MRHVWSNRVGMVTLVGVMVLSAGLVFMVDRALAEKDDKDRGSATVLSGVTQNWDKNLPSASRFTVLAAFGGAAVRDNNTGLVWEQVPDATLRAWQRDTEPLGATHYCVNKNVGGTRGWRLPSVAELASLIDPALPAPFVPTSVFTGVQSSIYWSASSDAASPTLPWIVYFSDGFVGLSSRTGAFPAWCVRGGMQESLY